MENCCCSSHCKKYTKCKRADINNCGTNYVTNYHDCGSASCDKDGIKTFNWCGEAGGYKLFEPVPTTQFKYLKSMNIDELAEWIDKHGQFDGSPWMKWFDENYCKKCEPIMWRYTDSKVEFPCSWCELNDKKCKFFPELAEVPNNKEIIKMWLNTEVV